MTQPNPRNAGLETHARADAYKQTGVDTAEADAGLANIVRRIEATWPLQGTGRVILPVGYFANVIEIAGQGIAICTDGVGSKSVIAEMMKKYDTIGIDCVAMNVNDMICVGAKPVSLVDYIAVENADADMLDGIAAGLCKGAELAGISISGGETAQLKGLVNGFDLSGTAIGHVDLDKVISGRAVAEGDVVIGVRSSGIHSNGMTLARRALFEMGGHTAGSTFGELDGTLGEELLRPTDIYVGEALEIIEAIDVKALINITGDGLLNLARVEAEAGFVIDELFAPPPLFNLIQSHGGVPTPEMFEVFNMGVGFCYVVAPEDADRTLAILKKHGRDAKRIGYAVADSERTVRITEHNLIGRHKTFQTAHR